MTKTTVIIAFASLFFSISSGCTEPAEVASSGGDLRLDDSSDAPLPADDVFFPEAQLDGEELLFRVQMLPGYYIYKDKIAIRAMSDDVHLGEPIFLSSSDTIVDEWFGEQDIFTIEAAATASWSTEDVDMNSFDVELSYQGCKKDGICYLPVSRVVPVQMSDEPPAQVESGRNPFETS